MAQITLRTGKSTPLTIAEVDANFTNLNSSKLEVNLFTGQQILDRLKEVDGPGSGLDADVLDGLIPTSSNVGTTVVARDATGNFSANTISANIVGNITATTVSTNTLSATGNVTALSFIGPLTGTAANSSQLGNIAAINYALLDSPALIGTPTAPTAAVGTNTTQLATTAFVRTAVTNATASLGTMSTQNSNAVTITGGSITGTTINSVVVGSNATGTRFVSNTTPTGGVDGDIWYQY